MERKDFYQALSAAPANFSWAVGDSNTIMATKTRGKNKGETFNPVTAVANYLGAGSFGLTSEKPLRQELLSACPEALQRLFTAHQQAHLIVATHRLCVVVFAQHWRFKNEFELLDRKWTFNERR